MVIHVFAKSLCLRAKEPGLLYLINQRLQITDLIFFSVNDPRPGSVKSCILQVTASCIVHSHPGRLPRTATTRHLHDLPWSLVTDRYVYRPHVPIKRAIPCHNESKIIRNRPTDVALGATGSWRGSRIDDSHPTTRGTRTYNSQQ